MLIEAEGCSTPAGLAGQVRPRPAESEHPGAEINHTYRSKVFEKTTF